MSRTFVMVVAIISAVVNYIGALPWAPDPGQHTSTVRHAVRQMRVREAHSVRVPYEIGTVPPLEPGPGPLKLATGVAY